MTTKQVVYLRLLVLCSLLCGFDGVGWLLSGQHGQCLPRPGVRVVTRMRCCAVESVARSPAPLCTVLDCALSPASHRLLARLLQASGKSLVALEGANLVDGVWGAARPAAPNVSAPGAQPGAVELACCRSVSVLGHPFRVGLVWPVHLTAHPVQRAPCRTKVPRHYGSACVACWTLFTRRKLVLSA